MVREARRMMAEASIERSRKARLFISVTEMIVGERIVMGRLRRIGSFRLT